MIKILTGKWIDYLTLSDFLQREKGLLSDEKLLADLLSRFSVRIYVIN